MESTALALVERPADVPAKLSPFGQMVAILEARNQGETATTHFGAVRWSGLPVRRILADAAPLVIDAVGKRLDRVAQTQADAKKIAEMTEMRLNVGLLLLHGSAKNAALAFENAMREAVSAAVTKFLGRSPSDPPALLADVWTRPAYLFLVACVKRGREEAECLRPIVDRIARRNARYSPHHPVLADAGSESIHVTWLEEGGQPLPERTCRLFLSMADDLARTEAILEAGIRVLKADSPLSGYELIANDTGLFEAWINTAVLKIANGDPAAKAGTISPEAAMSAHAIVRQSDQAKTVARIREIVRVRTAGMAPESRVVADAFVARTANRHVRRLSRDDAPLEIDRHFIDPYLSSGAIGEIDHNQAIQYLVETSVDGSDVLPEHIRDAVERAIDWKQFDATDVGDIVRGGKLPISSVVSHLGDMKKSIRAQMVGEILDEHPEFINEMLDGGHIAWKPSLGTRFEDALSPKYLARTLRDRLGTGEPGPDVLLGCVPAMLRLPDPELRGIWDDPTLRASLVDLVDALLFEVRAHDVTKKAVERLVAAAGEPFERVALAAYSVERAMVYADIDNSESGYPDLPSWEDTAAPDKTEWTFVNALRATLGPRLPALIAANSEDDCYSFAIAGQKNQAAKLKAFQKSRDAFNSTRKQPPAAPP